MSEGKKRWADSENLSPDSMSVHGFYPRDPGPQAHSILDPQPVRVHNDSDPSTHELFSKPS
jgi:hypothetical protein